MRGELANWRASLSRREAELAKAQERLAAACKVRDGGNSAVAASAGVAQAKANRDEAAERVRRLQQETEKPDDGNP
jgi:hypothetical protein